MPASRAARIVSVDTTKARALRGVAAVMTAEDVPSNELVERASGGLGELLVAMPILAADRVRYAGEPVALVAAETPQLADDAAELVQIEYEELPGRLRPRGRARARGAARPRRGQRAHQLAHPPRRCRGGARSCRGRDRGRVPDPARRARLFGARGRSRLDRERRDHSARSTQVIEHATRSPRYSTCRRTRSGDRLLHGRRLRRQRGHDRRALPRPCSCGSADAPCE